MTIRAMVAQEESRKMSERIKAGQAISRKNGVLYGNGNLLGYDRVGDTYVINQEQAETVRMIFDLYESGLGVQAIRNELIKRERKNSSGLIKWDSTRILRCLKNTIYKGVGYKYGSYSEIELCRNENWGANEILTRGKKLLIFINERWGLSLKSADFAHILGLDFMNR